MGRRRAHTIHTGLSVCELYAGTLYPGTIHPVLSDHASSSTPRWTCSHASDSRKWLCGPSCFPLPMVRQEGSQVQLLLRYGSVRAKPVKKHATLLIHFAALEGPPSYLDCRGISMTRVINPEDKFPSGCSFSILLQGAHLRVGGSFDGFNHSETSNWTDLTSPDKDSRHPYQCLVRKQRENRTGFLLTPAPLTNASQKTPLAYSVCLFVQHLYTPIYLLAQGTLAHLAASNDSLGLTTLY